MSKVSEYITSRMEELVCGEECAPVGDYCYDIAYEVKEKFNTQCMATSCGGFDSPGYDVTCYAIAFIDENGVLNCIDYQEEHY